MARDNEVINREKDFHDKRFSDDSLRKEKVGRFYKITGSIRKDYQEQLERFAVGGRVLEFGCGKGGAAFTLAEKATAITAIDISTVAIQEASAEALKYRLKNVRFLEMNAEKLDFNEKFNLVCGSGILHHLRLEVALHEIKRILEEGGHAVFIEPLGHNPFINLYRSLTPDIRSQDEHPLLAKDLETIKKLFPIVEIRYYYLTCLVAAFFSKTPIFKPILWALEQVDKGILKIPWVKNWAWQVLLVVQV